MKALLELLETIVIVIIVAWIVSLTGVAKW